MKNRLFGIVYPMCALAVAVFSHGLYSQQVSPPSRTAAGDRSSEKTGGNPEPKGGGRGGRGGPGGGGRPQAENAPIDDPRFIFKTDFPAHPMDVILVRPTDRSVTVSVLSEQKRDALIQYGAQPGALTERTSQFALKAGEPFQMEIASLKSATRYYYRIVSRVSGGAWEQGLERTFVTQRASGENFRFVIQADSHLDYNTDPALYLRCLSNMSGDRPDFLIDLGDTFMNDKHRGRETISAQYLAQRYYFGTVAHSMPLFFVQGNHDGEAGRWLDSSADNLAVWSNLKRKSYFPNPVPGGIYSGNTRPDPAAGMLENYFAWEWGDALLVVLDPFWFTPKRKGEDENWARTLGREQYDWLQQTLQRTRAKYRFVFIHHLVGGKGKDARGGAEASVLYEWGGKSPEGEALFAQKRSGWPLPIHDLLRQHRVQAVFHGHDHLYVHQEREGIVYQEVPQPGHPRYDNTRSAEEYGYQSGTLQGSSGHLRVSVGPERATVEYVRAYLSADEREGRRNGTVSHRYELTPVFHP